MNIFTTFQHKQELRCGRRGYRRASVVAGLVIVLANAMIGIVHSGVVTAADVGSIVMTEFMADPTAVSDTNGEWIELENKASAAISLEGWDINGSTIGGSITLAPGARAVICKNAAAGENGGVVCDAASGFSLAQTGDVSRSIQLRDATNAVIHSIAYVGVQDVIVGRSTYVHQNTLSSEATYQYNTTDYGTPNHNNIVNQGLAHIGVHNTTDLNKNGTMDFNGESGIHNIGWTIRLYAADWSPAYYGDNGSNEVVTTRFLSSRPAVFRVPAGSYFVCQVSKSGMPLSFVASVTSWVTWDDNGVANGSGRSDEDSTCIAINGIAANQRTTHKFGNSIDSEPAQGQILVTVVDDTDADGGPDWNGTESHQAGWDIRLYSSQWQHLKTVTTNDKPYFPAGFTIAPGNYHVCEVMKPGYIQSFARTITSWTTWPEAGSPNQSGNNGEGEQCIAVVVTPAGTTSQLFGNSPTGL